MISIIIPVLDAASTLGEQMTALTRQQAREDWEIIVVDNASRDHSIDIAMSFATQLPVRAIDGSAYPGRAAVRNFATTVARGDQLVFIDADDVVADDWLVRLLAGGDQASVVAGVYKRVPRDWTPGRAVNARPTRPSWCGQPILSTNNLLIDRALLESVGGFDKSYPCRVDVELALRLRRNGIEVSFVDDAIVHYRERGTNAGKFRQAFCWGVTGARLYRDYGHEVPLRHSSRNSVKHWGLNLLLAPVRAMRRETRGDWCTTMGTLTGQLVGSLRYRVLFL